MATYVELMNISNFDELVTALIEELKHGRHQPVDQLLDQVELLRDQFLA